MTFKLFLFLLLVSNFFWTGARMEPQTMCPILEFSGGFSGYCHIIVLLTYRKRWTWDHMMMSHWAFRLVCIYTYIYPSYTKRTKVCLFASQSMSIILSAKKSHTLLPPYRLPTIFTEQGCGWICLSVLLKIRHSLI